MEMLSGDFRNTLDEKGRISFPAKLRKVLQKNELVVTQGLDHCLMLFTTEEWESLNSKIMGQASVFDPQKRKIMRHFIAPAQQVEFDKSGRLSIPQSLRDYASLKSGGECAILAMGKFMELWDSETYSRYNLQTESELEEAAASFGDILL